MAYTNVWDDTKPTGAEAANTIDDIFRSLKVDLEQRFIDIFNMANFTADPLRAGGLKFYDTADAKLFFGDNAGTPRAILLRDKADTVTYATWAFTGITLTAPTLTGASVPFYNVTQTWNNGATTFVGMVVNITSTASAAASLFFDYQLAGVSQWKVTKSGAGTLTGLLTSVGVTTSGIITSTATSTVFSNTTGGISPLFINFTNTSGQAVFAVEGSAGSTTLSGSTAYAMLLGHTKNLPLQFFTNNVLRFSISGAGASDFNSNPISGVTILTATGNIAANGYTAQQTSIALNTITATDIPPTGHGAMIGIIRDQDNGGSAVVYYDNGGTVTIISTSGVTTFVTGAPGATQIQLADGGTKITGKAGSSRNGVHVNFAALYI